MLTATSFPADTSKATDVTKGGRRQILCFMRMPPDLDGHGGSQRARYLLDALLPHGDVHFVLLYRHHDLECADATLESIAPLVASSRRICIAGWAATMRAPLGIIPIGVWNIVRMGSQEAPRLSTRELKQIADQLPLRDPDLIFAGRLCTAFIVQSMIDRGLLKSSLKVADYDDLMSKFKARQVADAANKLGFKRRLSARWDVRLIERAEEAIARSWHGVSVCTDEDAASLRSAHAATTVVKVPNVVQRTLLEPRLHSQTFSILFAGNLRFTPNIDGLKFFADVAWPLVRKALPNAEVIVVGMNPSADVAALCKYHGFALHPNVPTMKPYYENCDVIIAPILFGSGTRIKILEAMAYGRAVVSTPMGAEGMGLEDGKHLLLADTMEAFAAALVRVANDPGLRQRLVSNAYRFQQEHYTPAAINRSVAVLLEQSAATASSRG